MRMGSGIRIGGAPVPMPKMEGEFKVLDPACLPLPLLTLSQVEPTLHTICLKWDRQCPLPQDNVDSGNSRCGRRGEDMSMRMEG